MYYNSHLSHTGEWWFDWTNHSFKGSKAGDPISPYFIFLCAEGFSSLLNDAEMNGRIQGVSICAGAPSITHLLFADDSLLLLKANGENAQHLRHVLQIYETCSGHKINKEKSSIVFSRNTKSQAGRNFMEILDLSQESMNVQYLGLPVYIWENQRRVCLHI